MRARLEGELNSNLFITAGLVGYVSAHDLLEPARVESVLAVIYRNARHIRNVALAPDNVVTHMYPLAGNEAVVGLSYRDLGQQWPEVERAMLERRTVLAGPIDLVQGGRALISRTPVFLEEDHYWGILSLVLDTDSLFRAVGFGDSEKGIRFALQWQDGGPENGAPVAGNQSVFEGPTALLEIVVPGGSWLLGAVHEARLEDRGYQLLLYRFAGYAIALLVAGLLLLLLEERRRVAGLALLDQLTGLPNRRWFNRRAHHMIELCSRRGHPLALVYVDLDGFKAVNDRLGHRVGDEVLEELGRRMSACVDSDSFLARIGGDEFVVLVRDASTTHEALARIAGMLKAIRTPIKVLDEQVELGASVGVAIYPHDGPDLVQLMNAADRGMYSIKNDRRQRATDSQSQQQTQ